MIHITEDKLREAILNCLFGDNVYTVARENKLIHDIKALSVNASLPLVEVDPEIVEMCIEAYNDGEKIAALKILIEEANKIGSKLGLKEAIRFLKKHES